MTSCRKHTAISWRVLKDRAIFYNIAQDPLQNSFSHTTFHCEFILVVRVNRHEQR